jgi:hypothetical protein
MEETFTKAHQLNSVEIDKAIYKSVQGLGHARYSFADITTENRPQYDLILRELLTHLFEINIQSWNLVQIKIKTSNIKYRDMYALHNNNTDDIIIVVDSTKKQKNEPKIVRKKRTHCWRKEANGTYSITEQHSGANRIMVEMPTVQRVLDVYNIPTILWYELVEGFGPPRIKRFGTKLNARTSNGINEYIFR